MAFESSIDPVDFDEAIEWFNDRVVVSRSTWDRMNARAKRRAFIVSGVAHLDVVNDVWSAMDDALLNGTTLEDFKKNVGEKLIAAWGEDVANPAWRMETIFRTNLQLAYSEGRYRQQRDPDVLAVRPYIQFDATLDGRETEVCRLADGTILPADDPWHQSHTPPCHFNCRSGTTSLTEEQVKALGGVTAQPTKATPGKGFGGVPDDDDPAPPPPPKDKYPPTIETQRVEMVKAAPPPPPPPPKGMVAGVHIVDVVDKDSGLAKDQIQEILMAFSDEGTLAYLEKVPLRELRLVPKVVIDGEGSTLGVYRAKEHVIEVGSSMLPSMFSPEWTSGEAWATSVNVGGDYMASIRATMIHEMGHHIHMHDLWTDGVYASTSVDKIIYKAYVKASANNRAITQYSKTSRSEYWAECFASYHLHRDDLRTYDPVGYQMVEDVLKARGILPS